MSTEQVNIRMSSNLVKDLDTVANILHISRGEWLKAKIAEEVQKEKDRLLLDLSSKYARGLITEQELKQYVDEQTVKEMTFIKKKTQASMRAGNA